MTEHGVSWLELEQLALDELPTERAVAVRQHVEGCGPCGARLAGIRFDQRPMPPWSPPRRQQRAVPLAAALAVAAGLVVVRMNVDRGGSPTSAGDVTAAQEPKGGALTLGLVRERNGVVVENPSDYADGDRFRVWVTCEPSDPPDDLVVVQGDELAHPFVLPDPFPCGSRVALPEALMLTGQVPVEVCLLSGNGVGPCVELAPAP